jgi:AraC-type DNA-binding domain-containing proteins
MLSGKNTPKEYSRSINATINFILKNLNEDLSLKKLSRIANYSPFHFQKIFKQIIGETPKYFITRMRLETSAHSLIMHYYKSISEIAIDSGFSSPATFARAFKNYFGVSAEELRNMPAEQRLNSFKKGNQKKQLLETDLSFKNIRPEDEMAAMSLKISVKKIESIKGVFVSTDLQDAATICVAFKAIIQSAGIYDLLTPRSKFIGIIYPHQNLYKAFVSIEPHQQVPSNLSVMEIQGGKFGSYKLKGDLTFAFATFKVFAKLWLPESGYRMTDICGYEFFPQNPIIKSYNEMEREVLIAVEPE